jgi:aspartate dehydrogenase
VVIDLRADAPSIGDGDAVTQRQVGARLQRAGLIGFGTIGRQVADGIRDGLAGDVTLGAVLVRQPRAEISGVPVVTHIDAFLACNPHVVIEAASPVAVTAYAESILEAGASLILASASGLLDAAFRSRLELVCVRTGARMYVASGALAGLDSLAAAAPGGLDNVALRITEPGDRRRIIFSGSGREGAAQFPTRLNVAASVALAAGRDVRLELAQEPDGNAREIELRVLGNFGEFSTRVRPRPRADRVSHIVALSLLATLRRLQQPIQIG